VRPLQRQGVLAVRRGDELVVGLVEDDEHVRRHSFDQPGDVGRRHVGPGGVVGVVHDDHLGPLTDRARHGLEVVGELVQGHRRQRRAAGEADVGVRAEGRVGEDHLVARCEQHVREEHEQLV
jgi:hypothetical protein